MRIVIIAPVTLVSVVLGLGSMATAQTRENGPWWPHPRWGASDQAGGSNWITPDKVLDAVRLVTTGQIYELGQVYEESMSLFGQRTFSLISPGAPTYAFPGANRLIGNDEFLCAEIGHVGTQLDGLGHIGARMDMADGSTQDVYYNGFTGDEIYSPYGLQKLGVERLKPFVTRGILIDVAGYKGVESLSESYEVTVPDVRGSLERQGMSESDLRDGDALLFRYGWARHWTDHERYNTNPAGIGLAVARWVVDRNASMVGADSFPTEVLPNPDASLTFPVHEELILKNGIFNIENLDLDELARDDVYEFLFVFTPIRIKGAAGSAGRPIAIR